MKVLLQDGHTDLFALTLDIWTSDPTEAIAFQTTIDAALFCADNRLRDVRIVVEKRGDCCPDLSLSQTDLIVNFPYC